MKENLRETKGITLVALAITIVVILILSSITINATLGKNGLITTMREAEKNEILAQEEGLAKINELKGEVTYTADGVKIISDGEGPTINSITVSHITTNGFVVKVDVTETKSGITTIEYSVADGETDSYVTDIVDARVKKYTFSGLQAETTYTVKVKATDEMGNVTIAQITAETGEDLEESGGGLPSGTGTTPYLPSSDFAQLDGTDLSTGLVIQDGSGNQYVWIEVPKTVTVYPTAGLNISSFTDTEYTAIETDLHTYTDTYRNGTSHTDTYYSDETTGLTSSQYSELKKKMLKSVYKNGGFWIGRYEAGIETNRTEHTTIADDLVPTSKENLYPLTYITCSEAQTLASRVLPIGGKYTSSLMFGVQWDLVLAFMHNKGGVADSTLTSDSKTIGNYPKNLWSITNTLAKYSTDYGASWSACPKDKGESSASILLTTGADSSFEIMNIYDIAGNVSEKTLEYTSDSSRPTAERGSNYDSIESECTAGCRDTRAAGVCHDYVGFRVSFY